MMNVVIEPTKLSGELRAPSSKSVAHRALICAALGDGISSLELEASNDDIEASINCLTELGAGIERKGTHLTIVPIDKSSVHTDPSKPCILDCAESGSTLRFMMGIAAALGAACEFRGRGRLGQRPIGALVDELNKHSIRFSQNADPGLPLSMSGKLEGGRFIFPGNLSSQFATSLLLASPLLDEGFELLVEDPVESLPYIEMTCDCMADFSVLTHKDSLEQDNRQYSRWTIQRNQSYRTQSNYHIEGDWSQAAFWLCCAAISRSALPISVSGLKMTSSQGDRAILEILSRFGAQITHNNDDSISVVAKELVASEIDARAIPDLIMPLSVVAAFAKGQSRITHCGRLRLKESDRLEAIVQTLSRLGAKLKLEGDTLLFDGVDEFCGAQIDCLGDHRVAMLAAIAASRAQSAVVLCGAEVVSKSYPHFFDDYRSLGAKLQIDKEACCGF